MLSPIIPQKDQGPRKSPKPKNQAPTASELFRRRDFFIENNVGFQSGSQNRSGYKLALWMLVSTLIDTLIVVSISCFGVILFSFLMKTGAKDVIKHLYIDKNIFKLFILLFAVSFWSYLILMRIFMGASFGEWSCQLRLGQPLQRRENNYSLRVVARTSLIFITGVFILPLISLIAKRDFAGDLTGLKIYSLV